MSSDAKYILAASVLLETIGDDVVASSVLEAAARRNAIDADDLIAAMKWLGVANDASGGFFLPNQIVIALKCPAHRERDSSPRRSTKGRPRRRG